MIIMIIIIIIFIIIIIVHEPHGVLRVMANVLISLYYHGEKVFV